MTTVATETAHRRRMVTVSEAMKYGGFGKTRFYQLVAAGRIEAVKDGRRTMINLNSVDRYLDSLPRMRSGPLVP